MDTLRSNTVSTRCQRMAELAQRHPTMRLTTLAHHIDLDFLCVAFDRTRLTFLGFTHYWGRSRRGTAAVKRKTASSRLSRSLKAIREWCARHRHEPMTEQHRQLTRKLQGHYAYYGITGNGRSLNLFFLQATRAWKTWLSRRSRKAYLNWQKFNALLARYRLPPPKIIHSIYRHPANP